MCQIAGISMLKKSSISDKVKEIIRKKMKKVLEDEIFKNFNELLYKLEEIQKKLKKIKLIKLS